MTNYMATFSSLICSPAHLLIHSIVPNWTFLLPGVVSVQFSHSVNSDSLQSHGPQHARLPCPSPTPRAYSTLCSSSRWCHPTISSSVTTFSISLQSFPASGSFLRSQFFASGGQSSGVSASASDLSMNIQDWFPLGWIGLTSIQSKGLSRVFSNTTVWKHQFFSTQPYFFREKALWSLSPHLLIPSHWGVSISHTNFEGHTKFNLYHHVKEDNHKKYKFYITLFKN